MTSKGNGHLEEENRIQETSLGGNRDLENKKCPEEGSSPRDKGHLEKGVGTSRCISRRDSGPRDAGLLKRV